MSGRGSISYSATLKAYGVSQLTVGSISVKIYVWTKDKKYRYVFGPFSIKIIKTSSGASNNTSFNISSSDTHPSIGVVKMNNKTKDGLNSWWREIKTRCDSEAKSIVLSLQKTMQANYKGNW